MTDWTQETKEQVRTWITQELTSREIAERLGVSRKVVMARVMKYALGPWQAKPGSRPGDHRHIPETFATDYATMTQRELQVKYKRGGTSLATWAKRLGLGKKAPVKPVNAKKKHVTHSWGSGGHKAPVERPFRDDSPAGQAQQFLQQFGPVYRRPDGKWQRGSAVLTSEELISRAGALRRRATT